MLMIYIFFSFAAGHPSLNDVFDKDIMCRLKWKFYITRNNTTKITPRLKANFYDNSSVLWGPYGMSEKILLCECAFLPMPCIEFLVI